MTPLLLIALYRAYRGRDAAAAPGLSGFLRQIGRRD